MKNDIHNYKRMLENTLKRIEVLPEVSKRNKEISVQFLSQLNLEGVGIAKNNRYMQDYLKFVRMLKKDVDAATKEDIKGVIAELQTSPLSENTKRGFKIMLRKLYRFVRGIDEQGIYPEEVKWMKLEIKGNHKKLPEILDEDEIKSLIQNCDSLRNKTLISLLAESGCRVSEIGTLQIKNVKFEPAGAKLIVEGKTGARQILVIKSAPYLQLFINQHPENQNPEAYLWINRRGPLLTYQRISAILKAAAKRAGIKKRVHPHLLRHTAATRLAGFMTDGQLKKYMGWSSSRMIGVYTHLSGKDTDEAILQANGIEIKKEKTVSPLEPKICLRCGIKNPSTGRCCMSCGLILEEEYAREVLKKDGDRQQADEVMNKLMQDPEVMALVKKKLAI